MKLKAKIYNSPNPKEGTFSNVVIEETSFQIQRKESYFKIDFSMYLEDKPEIVLETAYIAFQGMNADQMNSNRKATFKFNNDSEEQEPRGFIEYLEDKGKYPENFKMVDWGYPSYQDALNYLTGGTFSSPEINPANDFVKAWILNTVQMKNELVVTQFQFVD
jgi:hypothetical protein